MKILSFSFLIVLISTFLLKAQGDESGELIVYVVNNPQSELVTVTVSLISELCWDATQGYPDLHNITDDFPGTTQYLTSGHVDWEMSGQGTTDHMFGLGFYRVSASYGDQPGDLFTIDYRTSDLIENFNGGGGQGGDVRVEFDVVAKQFYHRYTTTPFANTTIWDYRTWISDIKTELEPLEPENLYYETYSDHPRLRWSHSSNTGDYLTNYQIHKKIGSGNWQLLTTIPALLMYTDETVNISKLSDAVYYKLKSLNGTRTSDNFSNTITVGGPGSKMTNLENNSKSENLDYTYILKQNYPNPFNPTTQINYSIKSAGLVTLKVYDMLGNQVAALINERKEAGNYTVTFDASNLPSGIYVYHLESGEYRATKKLLLVK